MKQYGSPTLIEYGQAHELTQGSSGSNPDNVFIVIGGVVFLTPAGAVTGNSNNNTCTQTGFLYGQCTPVGTAPGSFTSPFTTFTAPPVGSTSI